ncbi:uncharacterized protein FOMMEDRAFT_19180 [Fomitiporia mediterranea MF3/22]|uniref:uncharacterized protein n=1 Tax=Fomitiporia mediterranea (strain MF3/22) TaxID=694068 RepID=UPI0004409A75|nr:uncharacterized protein FOMMEDRAFT_19180 [Fomitiporia mediterranea MF3/22]EJD03830.1 hypothetical protein FOMMEDRAFT_19180 [Fomitiporia mediterranea MF3/22]
MQADEKAKVTTTDDLIYDVEGQSSSSAKLQRTRDAIGNRTAFIIQRHNAKRTTLDCETLGIKYELNSTTSWLKWRTWTKITRRGPKDTQEVLVAEWELNTFKPDRIRFESSALPKDFVLTKDYMQRIGWFIPRLSFASSYVAQGQTFVWKAGVWALKMYREGSDEALATMFPNRCFPKSRYGFLEVPPYQDLLDELIVSWAIVIQRRNERHAMLSLLHTILWDGVVMTLLHVYVWDNHPSS